MDTKTRFRVLASSALACLGVMFAPVSSAGDTPISLRYAGSGWDTHVDGFVPGNGNVSLTTGTGQGTFGNLTITITTEWLPDNDNQDITCSNGFTLKYALVYSAAVLTFQEQSQLFGVSYSGWICASNDGRYYGEVSGSYAGGTGRFQAATGHYVSTFDGAYLEPNLGFRSIQGTVAGTVSRP